MDTPDGGTSPGTGVDATTVLNALCCDLEVSGEVDSVPVVVCSCGPRETDCVPAK